MINSMLNGLQSVLFGGGSKAAAPAATEAPQPYNESGVMTDSAKPDPIDMTAEPYRAPKPVKPMDPKKRFLNEVQSMHRFSTDATEDEASYAIDRLREIGALAPEFEKIAGNDQAMQDQAMAAVRLHLDATGGKINADTLRDGLTALLKNPPVPKTMSEEDKSKYFDKMFADLPEKPSYDPRELMVQAFSALLAGGGGQAGNILSQSIAGTQQRMQGDYQRQVQNADIQSKRAAAEYQVAVSDVQQMNRYAEQRYQNEVNIQRDEVNLDRADKKDDKADERYMKNNFYNAKLPGSVLDAANELGWAMTFDKNETLQQEGTDPRVWAQYKAAKLNEGREARLVAAEQEDVKNRELKGFRDDLENAMAYTQQLTPDLAEHFAQQKAQLEAKYPGAILPPIIDSQSYKMQIQLKAEQFAKDKFKYLKGEDLKKWAHTKAMEGIAQQRLAIAKARGTGVAGSVVNETTRRTRESKIVEAYTNALNKDAAVAQRNEELKTMRTSYNDELAKADPKSKLPFSLRSAAESNAKEISRQIAQFQEDTAKLKGESAGLWSAYRALTSRWGEDGLKGLPSDEAAAIPPTNAMGMYGPQPYGPQFPTVTPSGALPGWSVKKKG